MGLSFSIEGENTDILTNFHCPCCDGVSACGGVHVHVQVHGHGHRDDPRHGLCRGLFRDDVWEAKDDDDEYKELINNR